MTAFGKGKKKELSEKRRELAQAEKRVKEIDGLIQKIYEDNVSGKISDERFATILMAFEYEQKQLKAFIPIWSSTLKRKRIKATTFSGLSTG